MDFSSVEQVADKVKEEFREVFAEVEKGSETGVYEECGDLLFAVVSLVRLLGVTRAQLRHRQISEKIQKNRRTCFERR